MQSSSRTSSSSSNNSNSAGGVGGGSVRKYRIKETMEKNTKPEIGDIFYNSSPNNCLSPAPVIPTSHQYGLVLVPNDHPHGNDDTASVVATTATVVSSSLVDHQNLKGVDTLVTVMSASSSAATPATNPLSGEPLKDNQSRTPTMINNRFKVVKIETTVPFKRGRWTCMDYFDHHDSNNGSASGVIGGGATSSTNSTGMNVGNATGKDCGNVMMTGTGTGTSSVMTPITLLTSSASSSTTSSQSSSAAMSPPPPPPPSLAVTSTVSSSASASASNPITAKNELANESPQPVTNLPTITNAGGASSNVAVTTTAPSSVSSNIQILSCTSEISDDGISETSPGSVTGGGSSLASPNQKVSANGTVVVVGAHAHENDDSDDRLSENGAGTGSGNGGMVTPVEPTAGSAVSNDQNTSSGAKATSAAADDTTTTNNGGGDESNAQNPVAIDNKIEQAMDLVKSHLMFAVREEVEVLKEKISELMDRINQLEMENVYLRGHVTSDVLAKIPIVAATQPKVVAPVALVATAAGAAANGTTAVATSNPTGTPTIAVSSTSNSSGGNGNGNGNGNGAGTTTTATPATIASSSSSSSGGNSSGGNGSNSSGSATTTPTTSAAITTATITTTTTTSSISSNVTITTPIVTPTTTTTATTTTTTTTSTNSSSTSNSSSTGDVVGVNQPPPATS